VRTTRGRILACDLVGVAVGVRARIELAQEAGLTVDRGVLVNRQFETSAPGVYAAGDCAQAWDRIWQADRVTTSWRNSREQGELAGLAMAGGEVEYAGAVAANYQLAAGLPFCSIGMANPTEPERYQIDVRADEAQVTFAKIVAHDGQTVGACLIGDLSQAGVLEQAVGGAPPPTPVAARAPVAAPTQAEPTTPTPERSTAMHKMTEQNLEDAFAGESQAHMKYAAFAAKAQEEGKGNVARLFQAASFSEKVHATAHLKVLEGIGSTSQNLAGAIAGEGFEIDEMYPAYIAVAIEQDEPAAQEAMNHAMQAEKVHHDLYARAKPAVDAGGDVSLDELWVCSECGHTMEGEAPDRCPVCNAPKRFFVKF